MLHQNFNFSLDLTLFFSPDVIIIIIKTFYRVTRIKIIFFFFLDSILNDTLYTDFLKTVWLRAIPHDMRISYSRTKRQYFTTTNFILPSESVLKMFMFYDDQLYGLEYINNFVRQIVIKL